jgi:hypothetical protein
MQAMTEGWSRAGILVGLLILNLVPSAAAEAVQNLCRPRILATETVATAAQRKAAGDLVTPPSLIDPVNGFAWPDTQLGVVRTREGVGYLFFASDGGCHTACGTVRERYGSITRSLGTLDDPLGTAPPRETILAGVELDPPVDYVGGGPVYRVPAGRLGAGNLLMVYHAERATYAAPYRYPDPIRYQTSFYSDLGLARSLDEGMTWQDLGIVIRANQPYAAHAPGYDIGDSGLVVDPTSSYFYIYFPDRITGGPSDTFLSVARVPVAALLDAAFAGGPMPQFRKYDQGNWSQPGLGGRSSSILPGPYPAYAGAPNIAYSDHLGRYVASFDDTQNISYAESADGIGWADPILLKPTDPNQAAALYAVAVGTGEDPARLGQQYYIFYTYYPNPADPKNQQAGWQGAEVRRLTVECP